MYHAIESWGERIRTYITPHDKSLSFGAILLRVVPFFGAQATFMSALSPSMIHSNNHITSTNWMSLALLLTFGVAMVLFLISPPVYPYMAGTRSVRQVLHMILLAVLPVLGAIYLYKISQPLESVSSFGIGYLALLAICLLVTVILLWALQPAKWVAQK